MLNCGFELIHMYIRWSKWLADIIYHSIHFTAYIVFGLSTTSAHNYCFLQLLMVLPLPLLLSLLLMVYWICCYCYYSRGWWLEVKRNYVINCFIHPPDVHFMYIPICCAILEQLNWTEHRKNLYLKKSKEPLWEENGAHNKYVQKASRNHFDI